MSKKKYSRPLHTPKAERKARKAAKIGRHNVEKKYPQLKEKRKRNEPTFMSEYLK